MGSEAVTLTVQSDLAKIIGDLQALQKKAAGAGDQIKRIGTELDTNLQRNTKKTEQHFERLRDLGRRVADQLRGYFSSLASDSAFALKGLQRDLGLRQQFKDATSGAVELHDALRKIGGSLDIAGDRLIAFQRGITRAFSEAGFGVDAAERALQGLAGTQVSGEAQAQAYALTATKLAQAGGQAGQEGEIARALTDVLRVQGIDQNNLGAMEAVANSVRGRNPLEKLQAQNELYTQMEPSQRGKYSPDMMAGLAAVRKEVGPEMDAFVRKMSQGWLEKLPATAQGLGKILGPNGINFDEVKKNSKLLNRLGSDTNASGATLGLSPEEARGLYALYTHADRAKAAQDRARNRSGTIDEDVVETRGLGENAAAVKNRVGGMIGGAVAPGVGMISNLLGKAAGSDIGSIATMGAGFAATAAAAGGLSKLGKVLGGKLGGAGAFAESGARAAALEQLTGQKTIPVYVVNVGEFAHLGGGLGQLGDSATKVLGGAGAGAAGGAVGAAVAAAVPVAIAAAGAYAAYEVEKKAAGEGKTMSMNDFSGGAKGGGAIQLLIDIMRQLTSKTQSHTEVQRERNDMVKREQLNRDAPSSNRGGSFAPLRREQ